MKVLKKYFLTGIFVLSPIVISILVVVWLFLGVDGLVQPLMEKWLGKRIFGAGVLATLLLVVVIGMITSNVVGQKLLDITERILLHLPILNKIFQTLKSLTDAFSPGTHKTFKGVVLVEYPLKGVRRLGFILQETALVLPDGTPEPAFTVYIPTNHVYLGDTAIILKKDIIVVDITVQQGMQFLLSAGASIPINIRIKNYSFDNEDSHRSAH